MMSTEVQEHEERHAALMAVAGALTEAERVLLLGKVRRQWPRLDGAEVADVLDITTDHDMFLDQTEPFYERFADQLPQDVRMIAALHALVLLNRELTPGRVISLLQRAGMLQVPRYPDIEVSLLLDNGNDGHSGMVMRRAVGALARYGVGASELEEFRSAVRRPGNPLSRNMADIAAWVTLVDRCIPAPAAAYDPTHDLAVVLHWLQMHGVDAPVRPAITNLRSHLDLANVGTAEASLRSLLGKDN